MKIIRAILRGHVNDRAGITSKLRVEITGQNTEFLSRINVRCGSAARYAWDVRVVVINSVNQKIVVAFALAVNAKAAKTGLSLSHARRQQYQTVWVTTEQREIHDLLIVDQGRKLLIVGVELC